MIVHFAASPAAFAQNAAPITKEIRAQGFTLTNASDHMAGTFSVEPVTGRSRAIIRNPGLPDQTVERFTPIRSAGDDSIRLLSEK